MNEPRKPIFGFLWPKPDPDAPVDAAYRQVRHVRIMPRGPIRIAGLGLGSVAVVTATGTAILANVQEGLSLPGVIVAGACATILLLVLRGWVVGTFVNDDHVTIETTWRRTAIPWDRVRAVTTEAERAPFLGLPIRIASERTVLHLTDGTIARTHVYASSPDLWLRPEAFDMARLRLERWQRRA